MQSAVTVVTIANQSSVQDGILSTMQQQNRPLGFGFLFFFVFAFLRPPHVRCLGYASRESAFSSAGHKKS